MKKVLIIAYFFPPLGGAGVQRTLKFVKYLPGFGWKPYVVTVKNSEYIHDESLLQDIPKEAEVYRTSSLEFGFLRRLFPKVRPWQRAVILLNLLLIPDDKIGWKMFALKKACEIIRHERIDVIYTTSAPYTSHLIGLELKKRYGLPWVADFRDEWSKNPFLFYPTGFHKKINKRMELSVLCSADKVISTSEKMTKQFSEILQEDRKKFLTITNGFDPDDLIFPANLQGPKRKFRVTYLGTLYGKRTTVGIRFLDALESLLHQSLLRRDLLEIRFVGAMGNLQNFISGKMVRACAEFIPYKKHREVVFELCAADALLLITPNERGEAEIAGKTFEYVASERPILALVPKKGEVAEIIRKTNTGVVVNPDDSEEIQKNILEFYKKWEKGQLYIDPNWDIIHSYERKKLTEKLARVFDDLILENHAKR